MQRINNFSKWAKLDEGQSIAFANEKPRLVRLDVNSADAVHLYILNEAEEAFFLGRVCGRDVVEFHTETAFSLTVEGGPVYLYSVDGDDTSFKILDPVIFTRIAERRRRNPELEQMMHMMNRNLERRLELQQDERNRLFEAGQRAAAQVEAARRLAEGSGEQPKPANNGATSNPQATGTGSGGSEDAGRTNTGDPPQNDSGGR